MRFPSDPRGSGHPNRTRDPMPDFILHNYPQSPVAEKVRVALGIKGMNWASAEIPRIPPKPLLTELTGGYRRLSAHAGRADRRRYLLRQSGDPPPVERHAGAGPFPLG